MSAESWKLENDLCRCCHSEGTHKNLSEPCLEGEEEVYSAMLQDTLDINISPVSGPLGTITYTICEVCIMRLQDAWSFKQQVLQCETRFHDLYTRNVIKMEPDSVIINVKEEAVESDNEGFQEERLADDSEEDFPMSFDDGNKSDESEVEVQEETKKAKAKPKAKPKAKAPAKAPAKKKAAVRSVQAADAASSETQQSEPKEKKGDEEQIDMPYIVGEREGIKQYICSWCQKPFIHKHNFAQHYRHVHLKMRPKLRACYLCPVKVPTYMRARHLEEAHGLPMPQCNACGKKFAFPFQVTQHQKTFHMDERAYACSECDMRFTVPSKLATHALKHSSIRPYQCEYCDKAFRWKKNLTTHIMAHLNDKRQVCFVCDAAFVQSSSLKYHITKKHPELAHEWVSPAGQPYYSGVKGTYRCNVCDKVRKRVWDIKKHIHIEHFSDNGVPCPLCEVKFLKKFHLKKHLAKKHNVDEEGRELKRNPDEWVSPEGQSYYSGHKGKYRCNLCEKVSIRLYNIKNHIKTEHFSENAEPCTQFEGHFLKRIHMKTHLAEVRSVDEKGLELKKVWVCSTCKMEFKTLPELRKHKRACGKKTCSTCKMEFKTLSELGKHKRACAKSIKKPRKIWLSRCPQCSREVYSHLIRRHLTEEHGLDVPTCGICGYTNECNAIVISHQKKVHFREKNVTCPHCNMKFYNRSYLQRHIVRHNPVKKFECTFCKKCFPRKTTLRLHEKIHTGDKRIVCYVCGDRFVQKASLNYHMAKHHSDKKPHRSSCTVTDFIQSEEIDRVNRLAASKETFKADDMKDAAAASY